MTPQELDQAERNINHIAGWWAMLEEAAPPDSVPTQADCDIQTLLGISRALLQHARQIAAESLVAEGQWMERAGELQDKLDSIRNSVDEMVADAQAVVDTGHIPSAYDARTRLMTLKDMRYWLKPFTEGSK